MVKIVPTPDWFLGNDVLIEAFSFIVLIIFSFLAIKNYKLDKEKRSFLYLGVGFGLVALAQLASVLTKLVLYYDFGPSQAIGTAIIASEATRQIIGSVDIFYYAGFFFQRFLTLCGFYILFRLPREKESIGDYLIVIYFVFLSLVINSYVSLLYHFTVLIILVMIVANYSEVYKKNGFFNTKILIVAFGILAFARVLYLFSGFGTIFAAGNVVEFISYTILLGLIIRMRKYGKKTKSYGHNFGHVGNNSRKRR